MQKHTIRTVRTEGLRTHWILATAVAAVVGVSSAASAQQRVGDDGRALDANNRIGSAGRNDGPQARYSPWQLQNDIVSGNITGGRQFRGTINTFADPFAFQGNAAGSNLDRFVRSSSSATESNANTVRPFFGDGRGVTPPANTVRVAGAGEAIPAPILTRQPGDFRLGRIYDTPTVIAPQPGQTFLPGAVNTSTGYQSIIAASPIYGVRELPVDANGQQRALGDLVGMPTNSAIPDRRLKQFQDEFNQSIEGPKLSGEQPDNKATGSQLQNPGLNKPLPKPFETPGASALQSAQPITSTPLSASPSAVGDAIARQNALGQQSSQYSELRDRLERYRAGNPQLAIADGTRNVRPSAKPAVGANTPGTNTPGGVTPGGVVPGGVTPGAVPPGNAAANTPPGTVPPGGLPQEPPVKLNKPQPLVVTSLTTGLKAKGLSDLMTEAETSMKAKKFAAAMDQYDLAEQVSPKNPLVMLGRAHAELGAGYFARAERHLRDAFASDNALLMAQYDLRTFIGEETLTPRINDLKDVLKGDAKTTQPLLLLAYIAYNTGNEARAAAYLDLAEKRAPDDAFFKTLRNYWALPEGDAAAPTPAPAPEAPKPEMNK